MLGANGLLLHVDPVPATAACWPGQSRTFYEVSYINSARSRTIIAQAVYVIEK